MRDSQIATSKILLLQNHYPDIAKRIDDMFSDGLPEAFLTDYQLLPAVVEAFKKASGIESINWIKSKHSIKSHLFDDYKPGKVTEIRQILIAVILRFYHPARLLNVVTAPAKYGLVRQLSIITGCDKSTLSIAVSSSVSHYSVYKSFKANVDNVYEAICNDIFQPVN